MGLPLSVRSLLLVAFVTLASCSGDQASAPMTSTEVTHSANEVGASSGTTPSSSSSVVPVVPTDAEVVSGALAWLTDPPIDGLGTADHTALRACYSELDNRIEHTLQRTSGIHYNRWDESRLDDAGLAREAELASEAAALDPAYEPYAEAATLRAEVPAAFDEAAHERLALITDTCTRLGVWPEPPAEFHVAIEAASRLGPEIDRDSWAAFTVCNDIFFSSALDGAKYYDGDAWYVSDCDAAARQWLDDDGSDVSDVYYGVAQYFLEEVVGGPLCIGTDCSTAVDPFG